MFSIIVASTPSGGIGYQNKLPWHIPEDLTHFKRTTYGHVVVMGYNTWVSLNKKPLPNRIHFILTSKPIQTSENVYAVSNLSELFEYRSKLFPDKTWFIIGGATVYAQFIGTNVVDHYFWTIIKDPHIQCDSFVSVPDLTPFTLIHETPRCVFFRL